MPTIASALTAAILSLNGRRWRAGEHRISLVLSTVLRKKKSTLIDLHHAAAVWGSGELFVSICLPDRFYVSP